MNFSPNSYSTDWSKVAFDNLFLAVMSFVFANLVLVPMVTQWLAQ